jgi:hypothetical protein
LIDHLFNLCTTSRKLPNGNTRISCKRGLWMVEAPTARQALDEARRYYIQYATDGEYHDIISKAGTHD